MMLYRFTAVAALCFLVVECRHQQPRQRLLLRREGGSKQKDDEKRDKTATNNEQNGIPASSWLSPDEQAFVNVPSAASARTSLKFITSKSHVAGTEGDRLMANYVYQKFHDAGIPQVSQFHLDVYLNYPASKSTLRLYQNGGDEKTVNRTLLFEASLTEDVLDFDETSDTTHWRNHTFHGYGASGFVSGAPLVYANYGRPQDFDALSKAGIAVKGTVVLVRYGQCFRGLKVMNAQERGAVGVLIYSDPADDGFGRGQVYPEGRWRPPSGVQRGSVQFLSKCPGDVRRIDKRYQGKSLKDICGLDSYQDLIPRIPSLPISYRDAQPLLESLQGTTTAESVGGSDYCGGLNLTYCVGPSIDGVVVELSVNQSYVNRSIPNVIGVIPGTLPPEQDMPVLLGNHRDAWVFGAGDPNSGTAALIEVAKGLGALLKTGKWKPARTTYLLSWSGEEYALMGSTGWAELQGPTLLKRAVAYLNVDIVVSGDWLQCKTTPSLATLYRGVLRDLNHSTADANDSTSADAARILQNAKGILVDSNSHWSLDFVNSSNYDEEPFKLLGSGSDFTAFLDHLGIASLDFSFDSSPYQYGQYHSIYDSFAWMNAYGGIPGKSGSSFELMSLSAQIWGLLAMRLATSKVVPLDQIVQGDALARYTRALEKQLAEHHENAKNVDLSKLIQAVRSYQEAAAMIEIACNQPSSSDDQQHQRATVHDCNEKLGLVERQFLHAPGLPYNRTWFKHVLQAPGTYLGYGAEAFPGIQEALNRGDYATVKEQVAIAAERVDAAAKFLKI